MNQPKVTVIIVGFESREWLPVCLTALAAQTYPNLEVLFVDNGSGDESVDYVQADWPEVSVMALQSNVGYAAANNYGIKMAQGSYLLTLNPDVVLAPDYIERLVEVLESRSELGGVQGKLLQGHLEGGEFIRSDRLDSTGDIILKDRQVISRGQGEKDMGQYDEATWVFSLTGAAALWRQKMLLDCAIDQCYFDEDFFAYKEDIDLCWRARLLGFDFAFVPGAVAGHGRGWGSAQVEAKGRLARMLSSRSQASPFVRRHSLKNRHLMMLNNEVTRVWLGHFYWISLFELGILLYALLREPKTLLGLRDAWRLRSKHQTQRATIMARRQVRDEVARSWFGRRA